VSRLPFLLRHGLQAALIGPPVIAGQRRQWWCPCCQALWIVELAHLALAAGQGHEA